MKKYILYILTGVAACGLCSCEDALDRYPKDRLTPDNFFHTEEECQLYTNDFYTMFPSAGTIYGETADIIAKTTLTSEVLGNRTVPATAGSWKWEKLRDINFFLQYSSNCADEHVRLEYEGGQTQTVTLREHVPGGSDLENAPLVDSAGAGEAWSGRWKRLELIGDRRLVSATLDPEDRLVLDVNRLNNSRRVEPDGRAAAHWGARWVFWLQQLLAMVGL